MTTTLTTDELLTTTRTVRKRLDLTRPLPLELVTQCVEVALQAPTGGNAQGWHWRGHRRSAAGGHRRGLPGVLRAVRGVEGLRGQPARRGSGAGGDAAEGGHERVVAGPAPGRGAGAALQRWLAKNPRFHLHFTPTSSSWLNLVERWFRDLTDKALRRGVFHSVPDLIAAIQTYLQANNNDPKPWSHHGGLRG